MDVLTEPTGSIDASSTPQSVTALRDRIFCIVDGVTKTKIEQGAGVCALEGMRRCGISPTALTDQVDLETLCVPGASRERFVYQINPENTDGIYVADHRAYLLRYYALDAARRAAGASAPTDTELDECARALALTAVPLAEYEECGLVYDIPVILLKREVQNSELSFLGKRKPEKTPKSPVGQKPHRRRAW